MKETKNVPQLRFSGFDDEWEEKKLGEIVTEFKNPVELPHNGYIRLGIRSHAKGTFHEYVAPGHELEAAQMSEVKADNLIMSITFAWEHAVAITDKNDEGKLVSQRFPQFSFNKGQVPEFYKYVIADEKFRHHLWLSSPGGAGRNRVLNIKESMEYKSHIPSSDFEQQKIGAFLSHVDSLIQAKTKKLETLKVVKKSLLQKCFPKEGEKVPEMRFAGFSGDWEKKKLGEVCQLTMGQSPDGSTYSVTPSTYILVQGNADMKDGFVFPRIWTTQKTKIAHPGDLIFSVRAPVGEVGKTEYEIVIGRGVAALKGNEFVFQELIKMNEFGYWNTISCGSTFESINSNDLYNAEISIPPTVEEQQKIGLFFSKYDSLISAQQREINKLKDIKKSLLQKMFV